MLTRQAARQSAVWYLITIDTSARSVLALQAGYWFCSGHDLPDYYTLADSLRVRYIQGSFECVIDRAIFSQNDHSRVRVCWLDMQGVWTHAVIEEWQTFHSANQITKYPIVGICSGLVLDIL